MAKTFSLSERKPAKRKRPFSLFSLKPYKDHLLSGQARRWIISAGILIFIIALIEACIWGNLFNFYFGNDIPIVKRMIFSAGVGVAVFLIIWIIDSSFVTTDMSKDPVEEERRWYVPTKRATKQWLGLLFRIMLLAITLYATIPALTRLSVEGEIQKQIDDHNDKKISDLSKSRAQWYDGKILKKDSLLSLKREALTNEIAGGKGSSGYGDSVVARSIRETIRAMEREIGGLKKEKADEIKTITYSTHDYLSKNYGVQFMVRLPGTIEEIAGGMEGQDKYKTVEKISRVYAILAFLSLLLLKLFSPKNVAIYFNESCQDLFDDFLNDQINPLYLAYLGHIIKDVHKKNITPSAFYDFWKSYCLKRHHDLNMMNRDEELRKFDVKMIKLNDQKNRVESEISVTEQSYNAAFDSVADLRDQLEVNRTAVDDLLNQKNDLAEKIAAFKNADPADIGPEDFIKLSKHKPVLQKQLEEIEEKIKANQAERNKIGSMKTRQEEELTRYKNDLDFQRATISDIKVKIRALLNKYLNGFDGPEMRVA